VQEKVQELTLKFKTVRVPQKVSQNVQPNSHRKRCQLSDR